MPAPTITTTIPAVVNLPTVADSVEEFDLKATEVWPQHNASAAAANLAFAEFNQAAFEVFEYSDVVLSARDVMLAVVNFAGAWPDLTGALPFPATTTHLGEFWILLDTGGLADVTLFEPGVSTQWARAVAESSAVMFDGAPYRLSATNVNAALGSLACGDFVNPVLNGGMRIAQSGTSFPSLTGQTYLIDGWKYSASSAAVVSVERVKTSSARNLNAYWLIATVNTPDTSIGAADFATLYQTIEGYDIAEYRGQTFTVSFSASTTLPGVYCLALKNAASDVSYIAEFEITAPSVSQFFSITIEGGLPELGTWDVSSGFGLHALFMLAAGSSHHQAAGSWQVANKLSSPSQSNLLATAGNFFAVTEVQINPGPVAARFRQPTYADELLRCQRYYERCEYTIGYGDSTKHNAGYWRASKRIAPALTIEHGASTGSGVTATIGNLNMGLSVNGFTQTGDSNAGTVGLSSSKIVIGDCRL